MVEIWRRKFELDGISPEVVLRIGDRLEWEHPPTLPMVMVTAKWLQAEYDLERRTTDTRLALPDDSSIADPDSPAVVEFREHLRRFMARRVA